MVQKLGLVNQDFKNHHKNTQKSKRKLALKKLFKIGNLSHQKLK